MQIEDNNVYKIHFERKYGIRIHKDLTKMERIGPNIILFNFKLDQNFILREPNEVPF